MFVKRDDDSWLEPVHIERDKRVSDLLELSRSTLKFKKSDKLSAYKTHNNQRIDDSELIRDIARLGTVTIKSTGSRANHENHANYQKRGIAELSETFVEQDARSKTILHRSNMSELRPTKRVNTTTADVGEVRFLNKKLKNYGAGVEGFVFEIIPEDYEYKYKKTESTLTFFSEKERKEKQTKIRVIPNWSEWQPEKALPCWGVKIDNSVSLGTSSKQSYRSQTTGKIPTAIVTKTSFHQVKEFGVKVTINEKAIKEAKKILKTAKVHERQNIIKKFNDQYCSFIYSGKFSVGGWLRTVTTVRRSSNDRNSHDLKSLEKCALDKTKQRWLNLESEGGRFSYQTRGRYQTDPAVKDVSDPSNIVNVVELKQTIKNIRNCTVFPANWDEKLYFTPVYKIMQSQAEATGDEHLQEVSDLFGKYMTGKRVLYF